MVERGLVFDWWNIAKSRAPATTVVKDFDVFEYSVGEFDPCGPALEVQGIAALG